MAAVVTPFAHPTRPVPFTFTPQERNAILALDHVPGLQASVGMCDDGEEYGSIQPVDEYERAYRTLGRDWPSVLITPKERGVGLAGQLSLYQYHHEDWGHQNDIQDALAEAREFFVDELGEVDAAFDDVGE